MKCEGEQAADGSFSVVISVNQLTLAEAQAIAIRIKDPFRAVVHDVLNPDGTKTLEHRDMMEKPQ